MNYLHRPNNYRGMWFWFEEVLKKTLMVMHVRFTNPWSIPLFINIYSKGTGSGLQPHPTSCSTSRYGMILKFVPEIPFVKWWQLVMTSATGSRDWCVIYRPEADFWWFLRYWKWLYQSSFIKDTYFGKFKSLIMSLAWETKKLF